MGVWEQKKRNIEVQDETSWFMGVPQCSPHVSIRTFNASLSFLSFSLLWRPLLPPPSTRNKQPSNDRFSQLHKFLYWYYNSSITFKKQKNAKIKIKKSNFQRRFKTLVIPLHELGYICSHVRNVHLIGYYIHVPYQISTHCSTSSNFGIFSFSLIILSHSRSWISNLRGLISLYKSWAICEVWISILDTSDINYILFLDLEAIYKGSLRRCKDYYMLETWEKFSSSMKYETGIMRLDWWSY